MHVNKHTFTDPRKCPNETCVDTTAYTKQNDSAREQRTCPQQIQFLTIFWWILHIAWQVTVSSSTQECTTLF